MGWGDVLGALGAGAAGVNQAYQGERERQSRERINSLTQDIKNQIAQLTAASRERISAGVNQTKKEIADSRDSARYKLQELVNSGNVNVRRLQNEGMAYVQELANQGILTREEMHDVALLNLKNIDKEIAAAHDTAAQKRTETTVQGQKDVADIHEKGQTDRLNTRLPVDIWRNQMRYGGQQQGRRGASSRRNQGPPPQKWGEFIAGYKDQANTKLPSGDIQLGPTSAGIDMFSAPGARPGPGTPGTAAGATTAGRSPSAGALPPGPGVLSAFQSDSPIDFGSVASLFDPGFGPSFSASSAMPSMGGAPSAPPAPPIDTSGMPPPTPVMAPSPMLDRSLADVGRMPPSAFGPGMAGGRTFNEPAPPAAVSPPPAAASSPAPAPAPAPAAAAPPPMSATPPTSMTDAQKQQRVRDLQRRYENARAAGRFEEMRSIEQLIRDAIQ